MRKLLVTYDEAAEILSISRRKIEYMVKDQKFPAPVRIDGCVLFRMEDLEFWIEGLE